MYKQISPADGRHFVSKDEARGKPIVFLLAVWALMEDGSAVIGSSGMCQAVARAARVPVTTQWPD
jgi:hypothetical protein